MRLRALSLNPTWSRLEAAGIRVAGLTRQSEAARTRQAAGRVDRRGRRRRDAERRCERRSVRIRLSGARHGVRDGEARVRLSGARAYHRRSLAIARTRGAVGVVKTAAVCLNRAELIERPRLARAAGAVRVGAAPVGAGVRLLLALAVTRLAVEREGGARMIRLQLARARRRIERDVQVADVGARVRRTIEARVAELCARTMHGTRHAVAR